MRNSDCVKPLNFYRTDNVKNHYEKNCDKKIYLYYFLQFP